MLDGGQESPLWPDKGGGDMEGKYATLPILCCFGKRSSPKNTLELLENVKNRVPSY